MKSGTSSMLCRWMGALIVSGRPTSRTRLCRFELFLMGTAGVADLFRRRSTRTLEAQLNMIQPSVGEGLNPTIGNSNARRDQIGVDAATGETGNEFRKIGAQRRFAAGKMHLQNAKVCRLFE